jgi:hypothetical protein
LSDQHLAAELVERECPSDENQDQDEDQDEKAADAHVRLRLKAAMLARNSLEGAGTSC